MIGHYEITRTDSQGHIGELTTRRTRPSAALAFLYMVHRAIEAQAGLDTTWGVRIWREVIKASQSDDWRSGYTIVACRDYSVMIRRRVDIHV